MENWSDCKFNIVNASVIFKFDNFFVYFYSTYSKVQIKKNCRKKKSVKYTHEFILFYMQLKLMNTRVHNTRMDYKEYINKYSSLYTKRYRKYI